MDLFFVGLVYPNNGGARGIACLTSVYTSRQKKRIGLRCLVELGYICNLGDNCICFHRTITQIEGGFQSPSLSSSIACIYSHSKMTSVSTHCLNNFLHSISHTALNAYVEIGFLSRWTFDPRLMSAVAPLKSLLNYTTTPWTKRDT